MKCPQRCFRRTKSLSSILFVFSSDRLPFLFLRVHHHPIHYSLLFVFVSIGSIVPPSMMDYRESERPGVNSPLEMELPAEGCCNKHTHTPRRHYTRKRSSETQTNTRTRDVGSSAQVKTNFYSDVMCSDGGYRLDSYHRQWMHVIAFP
jgi:hypothetical protein